ncbi:hypothetical protein [Parapedobacter sp. DT-150]|uniref:hypothetical protein n=1 Tax=Parapedobacter sp. DT-150 TaxID=3396162 RepID=UPI003F1DC9F6
MHNLIQFIRSRYLLLAAAASLLSAVSCDKEGILRENQSVAKMSLMMGLHGEPGLVVDVLVDGHLVQDSVGPTATVTAVVAKRDTLQRLVIRQSGTDRTFVDTLLDIPQPYASFFVLQLQPDRAPTVIAGVADAGVSPDSCRIALYTDDPYIREGVDVHVYLFNRPTYEISEEPVAIFHDLRQQTFTDYHTLLRFTDSGLQLEYLFELRDPQTGELVEGFGNNSVTAYNPYDAPGMQPPDDFRTYIIRLRTDSVRGQTWLNGRSTLVYY